MNNQICNVEKKDYLKLIAIWEESVRATHHFLPGKEIQDLRTLILDSYFDTVSLKCVKNLDEKILGFISVADNKIEMLFISPAVQGQGIGTALCQYAIQNMGATQVDVNE